MKIRDGMAEGLKLLAEDAADLDIIAAAAQDALVRVGDLAFDKKSRRFTFHWSRSRKTNSNSLSPTASARVSIPCR